MCQPSPVVLGLFTKDDVVDGDCDEMGGGCEIVTIGGATEWGVTVGSSTGVGLLRTPFEVELL